MVNSKLYFNYSCLVSTPSIGGIPFVSGSATINDKKPSTSCISFDVNLAEIWCRPAHGGVSLNCAVANSPGGTFCNISFKHWLLLMKYKVVEHYFCGHYSVTWTTLNNSNVFNKIIKIEGFLYTFLRLFYWFSFNERMWSAFYTQDLRYIKCQIREPLNYDNCKWGCIK